MEDDELNAFNGGIPAQAADGRRIMVRSGKNGGRHEEEESIEEGIQS